MTIEELKLEIKSLDKDLEKLDPNLFIQHRNYDNLLKKSEKAYTNDNYLEAFLIQSCIIEGVIKRYAYSKLNPIISKNHRLKNKFKDSKKEFESENLAKLIDTLFITGKIGELLYEELDNYRDKRNDVVHSLLTFKNSDELNENLKEAYKRGNSIKTFIVRDLEIGMSEKQDVRTILQRISELKSGLRDLGIEI